MEQNTVASIGSSSQDDVVRYRFYSHEANSDARSADGHAESERSPVLHNRIKSRMAAINSTIPRRYHIFESLGDDLRNSSSLSNKYSTRFYVIFALTCGYMLVEFIIGILIGSLALYADAIHMLSDLVALADGYYSIRAVDRPATPQATFGFQRMEVLGGLINAVFLLSLCFTIVIDALQRIFDPNSDDQQQLRDNAKMLCIVAAIGFGINFLGMMAFGGHGHSHSQSHSHSHSHGQGHAHGHGHAGEKDESKEKKEEAEEHDHDSAAPENAHGHGAGGHGGNLNIRALFMHALGDALGSVAVIISGVCIIFIDSSYAVLSDPLSSLFITVMIMLGTIPVFRASLRILLHEVPTSVDTEAIRSLVLTCPGVLNVHDLHVWPITPTRLVCSMHILFDVNVVATTADFMHISDELKPQLHAIGIHLSTIQPEFTGDPLLTAQAQEHGPNPPEPQKPDYCHEPICLPKTKGKRKAARKYGSDAIPSSKFAEAVVQPEERQNQAGKDVEPSQELNIGVEGVDGTSQAAVECIKQSCCNSLTHRRSDIKAARA